MIEVCTLTGVDARTDLDEVLNMGAEYPFLEFATLLSRNGPGKDSRFPYPSELERIADEITGRVRTSLHICGRAVAEFVGGDERLREFAARFDRIQLNFNLARVSFAAEELRSCISELGRPVITQHFPSNASLAESVLSSNHHVLFDTSGGRGIGISEFNTPFAGKKTGYAGGIGPQNVERLAREVQAVSGEIPVWVDMESMLRTDDTFDLEKCRKVAQAVAMVVAEHQIEAVCSLPCNR